MQEDPFPNAILYHGNNSTTEMYRIRDFINPLDGRPYFVANLMGVLYL